MTVQYDFHFQSVSANDGAFCQVLTLPVTASGSISAAQVTLAAGGVWYDTAIPDYRVQVAYRVLSGGYPGYSSSEQTVHLTANYFEDIFNGAHSISAGDVIEVILFGHGVNVPPGLTVSITA
jgi:hypothetical protein